MNCVINNGEIVCDDDRHAQAGLLQLRDGAVIRALPEGGFVIE